MIEVNGWNQSETIVKARSLCLEWLENNDFDIDSDDCIKDNIPPEFTHTQLRIWFMRGVNEVREIMNDLDVIVDDQIDFTELRNRIKN